jgi:SAM-dependent methyltransferase
VNETWLDLENLTPRQRVMLFRLFPLVETQCNGHERVYVADVDLRAFGAGKGAAMSAPANFPPVLDACCGSRMFWFDRADLRAVFVDKRRETHTLPDVSSAGGSRELVIDPDIVADFTALPFPDNRFAVVIFDPPHFARNGSGGIGKKYGTLEGDWREMLRLGFAECFRVLKPEGTLIFKWNEDEVPVSQILALTPERPLIGNRCGKTAKSHWIVFLKSSLDTQKVTHVLDRRIEEEFPTKLPNRGGNRAR